MPADDQLIDHYAGAVSVCTRSISRLVVSDLKAAAACEITEVLQKKL